MIIVGSTALKHFGLNRREPKDLDVWFTSMEHVPIESDSYLVTHEVMNLVPTHEGHATSNAVYTIKCSHLAYNIKWEKTKADILWLKSRGCKLLPELYAELRKLWKIDYGDKSFLSLTKNKTDFFNDHVSYKYDHDYLHTLVSYPNLPLYTKCLQEREDVLIDKVKFFNMSTADQLRMFKEEITVIALERWVVHGNANWYVAYGMALKKTITNLTKNWAADFIISNLDYYTKPEYLLFKHPLEKLNLKGNGMNKARELVEEFCKKLGSDEDTGDIVFRLAEGGPYCLFSGKDYDVQRAKTKEYLADWGYKHLMKEGGEGGAEYCRGVFELKGVAIAADYRYMSHYGHSYDSILETLTVVTPTQKTITTYE
jgi:hypothetical protein